MSTLQTKHNKLPRPSKGSSADAHEQPDDIQEIIYAMRVPVMSVIFTDIDIDFREHCRFSASSLRSSDRVAPVMRASSDSLGRAINAVLPTAGVRPFLPAIK
jgi:hypothetical protein